MDDERGESIDPIEEVPLRAQRAHAVCTRTKINYNKTVIDRRLRPRCCHLSGAATLSTRHFLVAIYTLCANMVL